MHRPLSASNHTLDPNQTNPNSDIRLDDMVSNNWLIIMMENFKTDELSSAATSDLRSGKTHQSEDLSNTSSFIQIMVSDDDNIV